MKRFIGLLGLLCISTFSMQSEAIVYYRLPLNDSVDPFKAWYDHATSGVPNLRYDGVSIPSSSSYWYPWQTYGRHHGTDFRATTGTSVKAGAGGTVYAIVNYCVNPYSATCGNGFGYHVKIRHSTAVDSHPKVSIYAHLSSVSVAQNTWASCGQQVGLSGNTGATTGPHLHFELWQNDGIGQRIDPFPGYWYHQTYIPDPVRPGYYTLYPDTICYQ